MQAQDESGDERGGSAGCGGGFESLGTELGDVMAKTVREKGKVASEGE